MRELLEIESECFTANISFHNKRDTLFITTKIDRWHIDRHTDVRIFSFSAIALLHCFLSWSWTHCIWVFRYAVDDDTIFLCIEHFKSVCVTWPVHSSVGMRKSAPSDMKIHMEDNTYCRSLASAIEQTSNELAKQKATFEIVTFKINPTSKCRWRDFIPVYLKFSRKINLTYLKFNFDIGLF
jgi:hypothetical protein